MLGAAKESEEAVESHVGAHAYFARFCLPRSALCVPRKPKLLEMQGCSTDWKGKSTSTQVRREETDVTDRTGLDKAIWHEIGQNFSFWPRVALSASCRFSIVLHTTASVLKSF